MGSFCLDQTTRPMSFSILPFMLLVIPIVEIGVFIAVGDQIGIFYTLLMIFVTAILGSILLRIEGFRVLGKIREEMAAGRMPAAELISGVMILIAGVLLLTPGFVTDAIGFLLFLPPVRVAIRAFLASRIKIQAMGGQFGEGAAGFRGFDRDRSNAAPPNSPDGNGPIVDLDEDAWSDEPDPSSPWRKDKSDNSNPKITNKN